MAFKMTGYNAGKGTGSDKTMAKQTDSTYTRHRGTGEIREEHKGGGFSIIKEGTSVVNRTRKNNKDWVPADKDGKNLPATKPSIAKQNSQAEFDLAKSGSKGKTKLARAIYDDADRSDYKMDGKSFESVRKSIEKDIYLGGKTGHIGEDIKRKHDGRDWTKYGGPKKTKK
tara:strand:+ start:49 stop:558 length:510 start_codon:yes stop_codon:yes gene_type:complete